MKWTVGSKNILIWLICILYFVVIKTPVCLLFEEDKSFSNNTENTKSIIRVWKICVFQIDDDLGSIVQKTKISLLPGITFENWNHPHSSLSTILELYFLSVTSVLLWLDKTCGYILGTSRDTLLCTIEASNDSSGRLFEI